MKLINGLIVLGVLLLATSAAGAATVTGPDWPAPGGTDFSGTGGPETMGNPGGRTLSYSNFDNSFYDELWWGPHTVASGLDGTASDMTYVGGNSIQAVWFGTDHINLVSGATAVQTRFYITLLSGTLIDPVGFPSTDEPPRVTEVTGDFDVVYKFDARFVGSSAWESMNTFYGNAATPQGAQGVRMSVSAGMWSTAPTTPPGAAVPLPGAAWAGMAMLAGLGAVRTMRRRRSF